MLGISAMQHYIFNPKIDIDNDGELTLKDIILALRTMTGFYNKENPAPYINLAAGDFDGDNKIAIADLNYINQVIADPTQMVEFKAALEQIQSNSNNIKKITPDDVGGTTNYAILENIANGPSE